MPKFPTDSANACSFYEVFCEQHHLRSVPSATVLFTYWSRLCKIEILLEMFIFFFSKVSQSRTQNSACSHYACQHVRYKNPKFWREKSGDDVILVQCPFNFYNLPGTYRKTTKTTEKQQKSAQTNFLPTRFQLHELRSHKSYLDYIDCTLVHSMHVHPVPFNSSFVCSFVLFLPSLLTRESQSRDNILRNFCSTMKSTY